MLVKVVAKFGANKPVYLQLHPHGVHYFFDTVQFPYLDLLGKGGFWA